MLIEKVINLIGKVVMFDVLIFVCGEMGIGKEMMVSFIYWNLSCVVKMFYFVDCMIVLEVLVELLFFG